jgi:predicted ATPase/DNA-binding winged helix-turn-helix (wHTH) protein
LVQQGGCRVSTGESLGSPQEADMLPPCSWSFPPFRLDPVTGSLWRDEQLVPLPPKPFAVLACLVEYAGQVVTKEALLDAVWPETAVTEGVLKGCIRQLRRVLGETTGTPQYIATVHRRGYRFVAPVMLVPALAEASMSASSSVPPGAILPLPSHAGSLPLLVGRETELTHLHQWWAQARQGTRQVVCVTGEAGIGKTTLVDAFVAQVGATASVWISRGQCIEQHGPGEPYLPLLEAIGRLGRGPDGPRLVALLQQYAPSWLVHLPALVPEGEVEALWRRAGGATRERMLRELAEAVEALTAEQPLVLVLEDLHWSDVSTLDWLAYVARRREAARLLIVGTYRPVDAIVQGHPVHTVTQELQRQGHGTELMLGYLSDTGVAAYLAQRFGGTPLPAVLARVLHQRTTGNPLFLVTVVDEFVRRGILLEHASGWALMDTLEAVTDEVPASLRHLIEQQFERLAPDDQTLLEAASVVGVEFAAAAVAAAVERPLEDVERRCAALARRGQFVRAWGSDTWPDRTLAARYAFQHALYQEVVYMRLPVGMRRRWHQQIGARLEAGYGARVQEIAVELAAHFVRGQDAGRAVPHLQVAGEQAMQRSAHQEAIGYLTQGLELLATFPATPVRTQRELRLQTALGTVRAATQGYSAPEVEHAYARAYTLCQQIGETAQIFPVLMGQFVFYLNRADWQAAHAMEEQLLTHAQRLGEPVLLLQAHTALGGGSLYWTGQLKQARVHQEQALTLYDAQAHRALAFSFGQDLGVVSSSYAAHTLWLLGHPDLALQRLQQALTLAQELAHPLSQVFALSWAARLHLGRREWRRAQEYITSARALATEQGFVLWSARATIWHGAALAMQGQGTQGIPWMLQGLAAYRDTGAGVDLPDVLSKFAATYAVVGQVEEGLHLLREARALIDKHAERVWEAEVYRLQGELLRQRPASDFPEAEACFQYALGVARHQQAKSLELRAAMSLSRLWQQQGKCEEARHLLAEIYDWFTEGFDTADLQEARELLHALTGT